MTASDSLQKLLHQLSKTPSAFDPTISRAKTKILALKGKELIKAKILIKIYGPKGEQGVWRIRNNLEIQNIYKSPDIVTEIKVTRLEWLGHVVRMEGTRLPKMVFNAKPEGRRGVWRPRLRWLDDVEADIKALGVKRWRIKAQDRKKWSAILSESKAKLKEL
jgi:hypothetical protein